MKKWSDIEKEINSTSTHGNCLDFSINDIERTKRLIEDRQLKLLKTPDTIFYCTNTYVDENKCCFYRINYKEGGLLFFHPKFKETIFKFLADIGIKHIYDLGFTDFVGVDPLFFPNKEDQYAKFWDKIKEVFNEST